jgi:proteasome-associated ATPase
MKNAETLQDARKTIMFLEEELQRLSSPPYMSGTILAIGNKTASVAADGAGVYEVGLSREIQQKVDVGVRVILHPETRAVIGPSEVGICGGPIASIEEVLDERLRVQQGGEARIILNGLDKPQKGDEVRLDPSGLIAVEKFDRKKTKYALEVIPEAPWTDIGGLDDIINQIKQEVEEPFLHPDVYAKYGRKPAKGVLLYGPPGCGKTMIGKAIAYNLSNLLGGGEGHFIKISGPEILDKWLGNSEANIRRIYESARDTAAETESPVVIFVDEAESVLKTRGSGISTDVYDSIVPQFLTEMDGLNGSGNVITVLATNREDIIDPAILRDGRVDRRIKVSRPTKEGAREIFEIYLADKPTQDFDVGSLAQGLAEHIYQPHNLAYSVVSPSQGVLGSFHHSHLMSGAVVKSIVDRASSYAIQREILGDTAGISEQDLYTAVEEEFENHQGFAQSLVKEDWQDVFGSQGTEYQAACKRGQLVLENLYSSAKEVEGVLEKVKMN